MNPQLLTRPTPPANGAIRPTEPAEEPRFEELTFEEVFERIDAARYCALLVRITPGVAQQILELNLSNRPLTANLVKHYAEQMRQGLWNRRNGQTISFDVRKQLDNGQHRLYACVESGVPLDAMCVFGNSSGAFESIDKGKKRSDADTLAVARTPYATTVAAAVKLIWKLDNGTLAAKHGFPFATEIIPLVERYNPALAEAVASTFNNLKLRPLATPAMLALFKFAFTRAHPDRADEFFEAVASGAMLSETDPRLHLRNRMIGMKAERGGYVDPTEMMALWIKAWNMFLQAKPCRVLTWRSGGGSPEPFPTIL